MKFMSSDVIIIIAIKYFKVSEERKILFAGIFIHIRRNI